MAYDEKTADMQEKYFNKYFCKARVVTENAYGMFKGRWRLLHKKNGMQNPKCKVSNHDIHCSA